MQALRAPAFWLIATAGLRIEERTAAGGFRPELFHLSQARDIVISPLPQRPEDALWLALRLLAALNTRRAVLLTGLAALTEEAIRAHCWPGNGREVRARMLRAVDQATGPLILPFDLFPEHAGQDAIRPLAAVRDAAERAQIMAVLDHTPGQVSEVARLLQVSHTTLWEKMQKLGPSVAAPVRKSERQKNGLHMNGLPRCCKAALPLSAPPDGSLGWARARTREDSSHEMQQAGRCGTATVPAQRRGQRRRCRSRRDLCRPRAGAGAGIGAGGIPANRLANLADLAINEPLDVAYPDADSPGVLLKLGTPAPGGVGPDGDIVGFSVLCPHKGWQMSYHAGDKTLNCPGHFSRFDCEKGGKQVWGHATQNLPQFKLQATDADDIIADGVDELIYGRLSNVLAV